KAFKRLLTPRGGSLFSEEGDVSNFRASACHIVRTILNDPSAAPSSAGLPSRDVYNSPGCGSLLITVTQDRRVIESLDGRGDHPTLNVVHMQTVSDEDSCKKQKVYDTDEFIHYLLNYYRTPGYARVCLEPKSTANKSRWKRVVSDDGSGFDISWSDKRGQHFREVSPVQNLGERNCSADNYRLVITTGELESTDTVLESKTQGGTLAKKVQVQKNDSLTVGNLQHAGLNHSLDCTAVTGDKEFRREDGSDDGTVPYTACRSTCRLKDLLEESSDSEYFRETRSSSMKRTERRCEETFSNCNKGCWSARARERKLLVYLKNVTLEGQEKETSKCSFCSNSVHEGAEQCEHKLKKSCKRSSSKLRCEGQRSEIQSREEERNARKMKTKRKKLSSNLLSDECSFSETDSCMQLESLRKIQRKCKKMFHKKMLHTAMAASDVTPCGGSLLKETFQRTGDERKLMLRREMDADGRGCPLFPLEIIQTNPCSDTFCEAEPRRGC
ncbi:AK17B protein, partial [Chloroceryle aenea]|nr:AK17B protein [Chloroceryle aenea]